MTPAIASPQGGPPSNGVVGDLSWKRFLAGGSEGVKKAVISDGGHGVKLSWADGHESDFSLKWLRDHSDGSFHPSTMQRKLDTFSISNEARISHVSVEPMPSDVNDTTKDFGERPQQEVRLRWDADIGKSGDEEECTVSIARLRQHCTSETARRLRRQLGASTCVEAPDPAPVMWGKGVLSSSTATNSLLRFEYEAIMKDDEQSSLAASSSPSSSTRSSQTTASKLRGVIKSHGIAVVRGVPTNTAATEALALKLSRRLMGGILGNVWAISTDPVDSGPSVGDSAYTTGRLPLHTDHSYVTETPGLLVLSCLVPASEGGESTYADGFAVAERLRKENPEAFEFFTKTPIKHQYLDHEYHLISEGPIIRTDSFGAVVQLRYHEHYRAPMDYLSNEDLEQFYKHHESLIAITRDPSMVDQFRLEQGDTIILNNHRAMHGRESYKGSRRMLGCFLSRDESNSEARIKGI